MPSGVQNTKRRRKRKINNKKKHLPSTQCRAIWVVTRGMALVMRMRISAIARLQTRCLSILPEKMLDCDGDWVRKK